MLNIVQQSGATEQSELATIMHQPIKKTMHQPVGILIPNVMMVVADNDGGCIHF